MNRFKCTISVPMDVLAVIYFHCPGLMEMVMTNTYTFPTSMSLSEGEGGVAESRENVLIKEAQVLKREKEGILEYENHLASSSAGAATITEGNSYLLNQLTQLSPK